MNKQETLQKPLIQKMCEARLSRDYLELHRAQYKSTSPYAVTDKTPSSRIDSNVVTFTNVDPMNGREYVDSRIIKETIYKCPVTSKEFEDKDLRNYKEKILGQAQQYGIDKAAKYKYMRRVDTIDWVLLACDKQLVIPDNLLERVSYWHDGEPILQYLADNLPEEGDDE